MRTTSDLYNGKFSTMFGGVKCKQCQTIPLNGDDFSRELIRHKYLLNLPGAGNWSCRLGTLLNSGSAIFQAESPGYPFYEVGLKPGIQ